MIVTDLEQTVHDRQRTTRLMSAVRTLPQPRTESAMRRALLDAGLPLRHPRASEACDSLVPRLTCSACLVRKPYDAFGPLKLVPALRRLPYQMCDDCRRARR